MKKIMLGIGLLFLISLGGAGTQSSSLLMQGMGFVGLIIGLIVLYVFGKMIWKGIGCLPSLLILSAIVLFIMYSLGMFNNGISGVGDAVMRFIGRENNAKAEQLEPNNNIDNNLKKSHTREKPNIQADFSDTDIKSQDDDIKNAMLFEQVEEDEQENEEQQEANTGVIQNVLNTLTGKQVQKQEKPFNPNDYPVVYGSVRVVNADTLIMYGKYFRLFGVDAPESNQTCANRSGRSYNCGREAAMWLKNWIGENELECHVIRQNTKGDMEGTCSYGPYDLGAALVNAGWAVANIQVTDIYYPYQMQAQENKRGLWQGQFYMPWDWRKMQTRKAKIKVVTNKKKKNMFGI